MSAGRRSPQLRESHPLITMHALLLAASVALVLTLDTPSALAQQGTPADATRRATQTSDDPQKSAASDDEPDPDEFVPVDEEPSFDYDEFGRRVVYPEGARRNGIEGRVMVQALIDKSGKPLKHRIVASDHPVFNESAVNAVMGTKFTPAKLGGEPVMVWITIPVQYKLG